MIVVDTNTIAARVLASALTEKAIQLEARDPVWVVPPLWRYEFQNLLATAMKAGYIGLAEACERWQVAATLLAYNEASPAPDHVLTLAQGQRITAYDASFIALAVELAVPCVTGDKELRRKFPTVAFSVSDFLARSGWTLSEADAAYEAEPAVGSSQPPPLPQEDRSRPCR